MVNTSSKYEPFAFCPIINRKCGFCTIWKDVMYCGIKSGENRIQHIKTCPKPKKKRRQIIPNRQAKTNKRNKRLLNKKLAKEGRTAKQVKRFKKKEKSDDINRY